jgi:hypothetical protein
MQCSGMELVVTGERWKHMTRACVVDSCKTGLARGARLAGITSHRVAG